MQLRSFVAVVVGAFAGSWAAAPAATAQAIDELPAPVPYGEFMIDQRGFIPVENLPGVMEPGLAAGGTPSHVLFLNNCKTASCAIIPGNFSRADDSRANVSSIVRPVTGDTQPYDARVLAPYTGSDTTWNAIVACVRENYAPFDIQVVTTEPPASTSYFEAFAAGLPANVGFPSTTAGVASAACGVIPNAISFSFLNANPGDVLDACWTISQESAHNFGLAHEMLGTDAMTYIRAPARKRFVNQTACIGTQGCCAPSQECRCGATDQNSFQELLSIFGAAGATPPTIVINQPTNNQFLEPGFIVNATVTDDIGVAQVELLIDGATTATLTSGPFAFNAPATIAVGPHTVGIRGTDTNGAQATVTVNVNVGDPCTGTDECAVVGEGFVCVDGRCVAGSGIPGGLGDVCDVDHPCLSGECATKGGENRCSEACDPGVSNSCGDGFTCLDNPAGGGLCWPGDDGTCAGCAADGGSTPTLPIGAGLMLSALLLRRRRRAA